MAIGVSLDQRLPGRYAHVRRIPKKSDNVLGSACEDLLDKHPNWPYMGCVLQFHPLLQRKISSPRYGQRLDLLVPF